MADKTSIFMEEKKRRFHERRNIIHIFIKKLLCYTTIFFFKSNITLNKFTSKILSTLQIFRYHIPLYHGPFLYALTHPNNVPHMNQYITIKLSKTSRIQFFKLIINNVDLNLKNSKTA